MNPVLIQLIVLLTFGILSITNAAKDDLIYGYMCEKNVCRKVELNEANFNTAISLPACRMFCGDTLGTLWPKPTGPTNYDSYLVHIDNDAINFQLPSVTARQSDLWQASKKKFFKQLNARIPNVSVLKQGGHLINIVINTETSSDNAVNDETFRLTLDTDESYRLVINRTEGNDITANITAKTFFGARHGLETLSQLIIYDDIRREVQVLASADIQDAPVYKWRGLLLDTSRNFYSKESIKRTLDGMSLVKLNTLHWHITDSHSFPLEVKSQRDLYILGAYSPRKVYTHDDINEIVEYGLERGIRVMPEFDAPAHVGEGWQNKNMTACFNAQPWSNYCVEPPCGQLDPTVDSLYPVLEDIYREMFKLFKPDVFHMGGDEVSVNCWNSSERIRNWMLEQNGWGLTESDFIQLWGYFQKEALKRVDKITDGNKLPIILWTSRLTDTPYIDIHLDPKRYIIQVWTKGNDPVIANILQRGYRMIISNYDALYFDCGGPGWVTDGNNWCGPFIGWQKVYNNDLNTLAGNYNSQVLGAEAAIWSEQIDEFTLDYRLWPRASALAERLWTNPTNGWQDAESRILYHRELLVENGIGAEALQPEWCLQNEDQCPINANSQKN